MESESYRLSIVIPLRDNEDGILVLLHEIDAVLGDEQHYEIICIDDGSTDKTRALLFSALSLYPQLRFYSHRTPQGRRATVHSGVTRAKGDLVLTVDGNGTSVPSDIPILLKSFAGVQKAAPPSTLLLAMIAGRRLDRESTAFRRVSNAVAAAIDGLLHPDETADAECALNLFVKAAYLSLPYSPHIRRSLAASMRRHGYNVVEMPVRHRPPLGNRSRHGPRKRIPAGLQLIRDVIVRRPRFPSPSKIRG